MGVPAVQRGIGDKFENHLVSRNILVMKWTPNVRLGTEKKETLWYKLAKHPLVTEQEHRLPERSPMPTRKSTDRIRMCKGFADLWKLSLFTAFLSGFSQFNMWKEAENLERNLRPGHSSKQLTLSQTQFPVVPNVDTFPFMQVIKSQKWPVGITSR